MEREAGLRLALSGEVGSGCPQTPDTGPPWAPVGGCSRPRPSSYRALRSAVSTLARIDDFYCEKIGSGFFSEVFKVRHRISGQVMVLKMNKLTSNRANMLREVQLMNRLSHPNILRFMGVCVHEGQLHALTEYINGGNLEQVLDSNVYLSWSVRIRLALDIAKGLKYLHFKGIFHRDLTSKNCLVRVDENSYVAVVGDFGLAEKIPNYSDGSEKQPLAVVGSPFWMAPEVLRGELYNEKADVFAYGIILCEIIARIQADPDYMPRTEDFGLDVAAFQNLVGDCPLPFLCLAVDCCDMDSTRRPAFTVITQRLEIILDQHREPGEGTATPKWDRAGTERLTATHGKSDKDTARSQVRRPTCSLRVQCETRLSRSHSDMFSPKPLAAGSEDDQFSPLQRAPTRINPFSRREDLKGGKIKLYDSPSKSVISLTFDLPAPASYQMNLPVTPEPMMDVRCEFPRPNFQPRNCRSLPSSPALSRRNLVHFDFSAPLPSRYWMGTEGGSEPPAGEGPEPTACSSGPVEAPTIAMDNQPWPLLVNDKTATVARYDQPWEPLVNDKMAAVARDDGHVVVSKPQHSETEDGDDGGQGEEDGSPGTENTESSPPGLEQDDMLSCPGCCLGGFTFPSLCLRPSAGTSRYRNLNCDSERLKENPTAKASARTGPGLKITQS